MEEFVAKENIRRFEAQLAQCDDDAQRDVLLRLLKTERKRLNKIQGASGSSIEGDKGAGVVETPQRDAHSTGSGGSQ